VPWLALWQVDKLGNVPADEVVLLRPADRPGKPAFDLPLGPAAHGPPKAFAVAEIAVPCLRPSATAREDGSGLTGRLAMALRIICMCGYVIQGDDDDELWRSAQDHMGVLHPELVDSVTREDILAQSEQL